MTPIRVLVAISNPTVLYTVGEVIGRDERVFLCSGVQTAQEALKLVENWRPDIVLLDMWLPDAWGIEVARRIKAQPNAPRVVLLSVDEPEFYRGAALEFGVEQVLDISNFVHEFPALLNKVTEKGEGRPC